MKNKEYMIVNDFSQLSGIPDSTLKHWGKIGLFPPAARGEENRYSYYSPAQLISVNYIRTLSDMQVPLKTIEEMKNRRRPDVTVGMIEQQRQRLDAEIRRLRESYSVLSERSELIRLGIQIDEASVAVRRLDTRAIVMGGRNVWDGEESFYGNFMDFCQHAKKADRNLGYPIGAYHETAGRFFRNPGRPDRFFQVNPFGGDARAAGEYVVAYTRGNYGELQDVSDRIRAFAEERSLKLSGSVYVIYLFDEICIDDPSQYLAQVCVGLEASK